MKIPKPTDADKDYFRSLVPEHPSVEVRPMFGNLAAFVNGNMFMGLFGPDVGLRLSEADRAALVGAPGSGPFGPPDRPMKEYVSIPHEWRQTDEAQAWINKALTHTAAMPAKTQKR